MVRDKNSGRIGTVVHEFEVPDAGRSSASPRRSSPTRCSPQQEGASDTRRGRRSWRAGAFAPGATLYCAVRGLRRGQGQGLGHAQGQRRLHDPGADGSVGDAAWRPSVINPTSLGKLSRLVGTQARRTTPPGEYEFVLSFKDEISGKTVELHEPFTVAGRRVVERAAASARRPARRGRGGPPRRADAAGALRRAPARAGTSRSGAMPAPRARAAAPRRQLRRGPSLFRAQDRERQARHHEQAGQDRGGPGEHVGRAARPEGGLRAAAAEGAGQVLALALLEQHHADQEQAGTGRAGRRRRSRRRSSSGSHVSGARPGRRAYTTRIITRIRSDLLVAASAAANPLLDVPQARRFSSASASALVGGLAERGASGVARIHSSRRARADAATPGSSAIRLCVSRGSATRWKSRSSPLVLWK